MINEYLIELLIFFLLLALYFIYRRNKKKISSPFQLNDYTSQQFAKLLGDRILTVLERKFNLTSVNPELLPLKFCSQWCEDVILNEYFKNKKNGFYIEIGAFDGVKLSNTYFFECIGWKGILIEPQIDQYIKCKKNRPNSQCINAAVSIKEDGIELNVVETENYETWSFVGENKKRNDLSLRINTIKVPTIKICDIFEDKFQQIDFISIDVEGMELEILKTVDLSTNCPEIILLENNKKDIQRYLSEFGYHLIYKTWINFFYSKNKEAFKNLNIWDSVDIEILG